MNAGEDGCRDLVANHQVRDGGCELDSLPCQLTKEFLAEKYVLCLLQLLLPWSVTNHKVTASELCRTDVFFICGETRQCNSKGMTKVILKLRVAIQR